MKQHRTTVSTPDDVSTPVLNLSPARATLLPMISAAAVLIGLFAADSRAQQALQTQPLSATAQAAFDKQVLALGTEKASRTPAQQKLDSQFVYALRERRQGMAVKDAPQMRALVKVDGADRVLLDVKGAITPALLSEIQRLGGDVISSHPVSNAARIRLNLAQTEVLAGRPEVKFIGPALEPQTNATAGQGSRTHRADFVRSNINILGGNTKVDGTGIKVGVMSDSNNFLEQAQGSGDLPATVITLASQSGRPGPGEGTAMMEIVNDVAPGAQLYFSTGNGGPAQMAANIRALKAAGCRIIVDDLTYPNESPFQDDDISKAVLEVSGQGVLYFSSATNSGNKNDGTSSTWEGDFSALGSIPGTGPTHNWGGSSFNKVTAVDSGGNDTVSLFWSDPLGASGNDYDLFVVNDAGTILRSSTNPQTGSQDPYESIGTINVGENVVVAKVSGSSRFLHLEVGRGRIQYSTSGRTRGHNASNAANAFSVAASPVSNSPSPGFFTGGTTNPVETFSSDGPRRLFYDVNGNAITPGNFSSTGGAVFNKPDITAADGVSNSGFYASNLSPFFGTSAAAPHAAAIAALLLNYNPALTPAQVRSALQDTALDIEAAGYDRDSGYGLIMADRALGAVQLISDPTPPTGTIDSPVAGTVFSAPTTFDFRGTASDNQQLTVLKSFLSRNSDNFFWNGSSWQSAEFVLAGDYDSVTHDWHCTAPLPPVGGNSPSALLSGSYTFLIKLEDAAGHPVQVGSNVTVQFPGPAVTISTPAQGSYISAFTSLTGTASDTGAGIAGNVVNLSLYQVNTGKYWSGSTWISGPASLAVAVTGNTWTYAGTLPDNSGNTLGGQYALSASTYDNNGNISPAQAGVNNITFTVDTVPPTAGVASPADGSTITASTYVLSGTADDTSGIMQVNCFVRRNSDGWYWNGSGWGVPPINLVTNYNSTTKQWTCTDPLPQPGGQLANGSYNFIAIAYDKSGRTTQADSSVTVDFHQIYHWTAGSYSDLIPSNESMYWGNSANWSPNGVPGPDDIVYIDLDQAVRSTVSRTVYGFNISTGALDFDNPGDSLTITKFGNWTGGTLEDAVYIQPNVPFTISGGGLKRIGGGGAIHNSGAATWTGPGLLQGYQNSTWNNKPGGSFTLLTDGDVFSSYSSGMVFNNESGATFVKTVGTNPATSFVDEWTFKNAGRIECQTGTIHFNTTLNLNAGSTLAGTGRVLLDGTTNLNTTLASTSNPELVGTLNSTAAGFTGTNPFVWSSGTINGAFTLASGSTLDLMTGNTKLIGGGCVFTNNGRVNWKAGLLQGYQNSTFNNESGAVFDAITDGDIFSSYSSGNVFNNKAGALFLKSGKSAAPDGESYVDEWTFNNSGTVRCDTGVTRFHTVLNLKPGGILSRGGALGARIRSTHYFVLTGTTTVNNITFEAGGDWHGNTDPGSAGNGTLATTGGGLFEWTAGTAYNTVNIATGSTFAISGAALKQITGQLNNSGNATWTGTGNFQGYQNATFTNLAGGSFTAATDADFVNYSSGNRFVNASGASFLRTAGAGDTRCDWAFNNNGITSATNGALALNGGGTSSGTFTTSPGGLVQFTAGTHDLITTAKFEGSGKIQVLGGAVNAVNPVNAGSTPTVLEIAGGVVTSAPAGSFTAVGTVNWTSGVIGGIFNVKAGSSMNLSSTAIKQIGGGGVVNNSGAASWTGPGVLQGYQNSTWNNKPGSTFSLSGDGDVFSNISSGMVFNNEAGATFVKTTGSNPATSFVDEWTFNNAGRIECQSGTLHFYTTLNLNAGSTLAGSGRVLLDGTTNLGTTLTSTGNPELIGTLNGTAASFTGSNPFVWSNGAINGAFTLAAGSTLDLMTAGTKLVGNGGVFTNNGRVNWKAGLLQGYQNSTFNNESGAVFDAFTDGDIFSSYSSGNVFNNKTGGLFIKSGKSAAPDGESYVDEWSFNNSGTLRCDTGVLRFHTPLILKSGGTITRSGALGSRIRSSYYFVLIGTTTVNNITFEAAGDWHGNTDLGTAGNGTLATTGGGVFEWTGGTAFNTVNIAAGSAFSITGTAVKQINGLLNNSGNTTWTGSGNFQAYQNSSFANLSGGTFTAATDADFVNYSSGNKFVNNGTFVVGGPIGITNMDWSYIQGGSGRLEIQIGGTNAATPQFDQLRIGGSATLAGKLAVTLVNGYAPLAETAYQVMSFGARSGQFDSVIASGTVWDLGYQPGNLTLTAKIYPDTYDEWKSYFFSDPDLPSAQSGADPDRDGLSNLIEYALGGDPNAGSPALTQVATVTDSGFKYLALSYVRPAGAAVLGDISYLVERSPAISSWSTADVVVHGIVPVPGQPKETVTVRSTYPITSSPKEFLHLKVVRQVP